MTDLALSHHAMLRMAQRGFRADDIDLILELGTEVEGGVLVRRKDVEYLERTLRALLKRLKRIEGKRVVVAEGCLVTAYHAEPYEQARLLRSH